MVGGNVHHIHLRDCIQQLGRVEEMVWLPHDAGLSAAAETLVGILKRVIVSPVVYPRFLEMAGLAQSLCHSWVTCWFWCQANFRRLLALAEVCVLPVLRAFWILIMARWELSVCMVIYTPELGNSERSKLIRLDSVYFQFDSIHQCIVNLLRHS